MLLNYVVNHNIRHIMPGGLDEIISEITLIVL